MELSFIYCCCVCNWIIYAVSELLFHINTLSLPYILRGFANFYPTRLKDSLLFVRRILKIFITEICAQ